MIGREWHTDHSYVVQIVGWGTIILPETFCCDYGLDDDAAVRKHVDSELRARGVIVEWEV